MKFITLGMDHYMYKGHGGPVQIYIFFLQIKTNGGSKQRIFFYEPFERYFFQKFTEFLYCWPVPRQKNVKLFSI